MGAGTEEARLSGRWTGSVHKRSPVWWEALRMHLRISSIVFSIPNRELYPFGKHFTFLHVDLINPAGQMLQSEQTSSVSELLATQESQFSNG
jgi:hypothetical protein